MFGKHDHGDSRLTCIDCASIICSKCMVQCPVGFRCKACGNVESSLTSVTPWLVARTLALCTAIGFTAGWILPFISVPFLSCIIAYFLGIFIGRHLARFIDYKLGRNIGTTIVFGLLIGMSLSPYGFLPFFMAQELSSAITEMSKDNTILQALTNIVGSLFTPVCFIVGVLRPTVWGERW